MGVIAASTTSTNSCFGGLVLRDECGRALTGQRQKGRYVYYKCTSFQTDCSQGYYREEVLAEQFERYVRSVELPPVVADWARDTLRESLEQETDFHNNAVERLNAELARIKQRLNQAYLDKLDGKIDDDFWARCSAQWQAEKTRIEERLARHRQADSAYLELGVRLIDVASRARELYLSQGAAEQRGFLGSILQNVRMRDSVHSAEYRPAFRVLVQMAAETTPPPNVRGGGSRSSKVRVWGPYGEEFRTTVLNSREQLLAEMWVLIGQPDPVKARR